MSPRGLLLSTPPHAPLARSLSSTLSPSGWVCGEVECRQFPDGEHYVNYIGPRDPLNPHHPSSPIGPIDRALVLGSLDDPDRRWLQLTFFAQAARDLGASRVEWVAPYLGYLRQDQRFQPGEVITARAFARMVSATFDAVWTVAPHLHRLKHLSDIYPIPAHALSASDPIAAWIRAQVLDPVLIGPDEESAQWVQPVAHALNAPWLVMDKTRHGDHDVTVEGALDPSTLSGRTPVLLDDIASTGQTLIAALHKLRASQAVLASPPVCVVIHPVFVPGAFAQVRAALQLAFGGGRVVSCDTIPHESNAISISATLAAALGSPSGPR